MPSPAVPLPLSDPTLFRQDNDSDASRVVADRRATIFVRHPATGEPLGAVPAMGAARPPRHR